VEESTSYPVEAEDSEDVAHAQDGNSPLSGSCGCGNICLPAGAVLHTFCSRMALVSCQFEAGDAAQKAVGYPCFA